MSIAKSIDSKISLYLTKLNDKQKRTVLTVLKSFAEDKSYNYWKDAAFVSDVEQRTMDLERGRVKGISWEKVKQKARSSKVKKK